MNQSQWAQPELESSFEFETALASNELYTDSATWPVDPLRAHGGRGANVLLRWNAAAAQAPTVDVVVHLHGFIPLDPNAGTLRELAARSGLELSGRARPTLAILPRGRRITAAEVQIRQERMNAQALKEGKKPGKARNDVYSFPALTRDQGAGLEALISGALQQFAGSARRGSRPGLGRVILTAHSGGGAALDQLVAAHARRRVCNPDEVHVFDGLYSQPNGLKSWVAARLAEDRRRTRAEVATGGGCLRVFYRSPGTSVWTSHLARSLPGRDHALSPWYRVDCTRVEHLAIPKKFGPGLLNDRAAELAIEPCAVKPAHRSPGKPSPVPGGRPAKPKTPSSPIKSSPPTTPSRAAPPSDTRAWIGDTSRSALELIADPSIRARFLTQIDWSREYFRGNPDASGKPAPGRLAESLFDAMARVVPENRVPYTIRFHDVARVVVPVPSQPGHKLFPEARDAFVRMTAAARAQGVTLAITSSWRSLGAQHRARKNQNNPLAVAKGVSAHMYGLAVDLNMRVPGLSLVNASTRATDKMANIVRMYRSPNYKWLALYGSQFGWFPYRREPWHWEYNPAGFKARFEGSAATSRELEFEARDRLGA